MPNIAVGGAAGPVLVRTSGSGRTIGIGAAVLRDTAPVVQTMALTGVPSALRIGGIGLSFQPFGWRLGVAGPAGVLVVKAGSSQWVSVPGGVIRGVDLGLQAMPLSGVASTLRVGSVLLRQASDSKLVLAAAGNGQILLSGNPGYHVGIQAGAMRLPGAAIQTMPLTGVPSSLRVGTINLTVGRVTWKFETAGILPANPIGTL